MSGNEWWSTKGGAKLLPDLVKFSIFPYDVALDFHESIRVVLLLAVNLLMLTYWCNYWCNSWVEIYLSWSWSVVILFSISLLFVL